MPLLLALLAGIVFGAGLAISDMVNPARVLNFLDLAGRWDPTLIFVMAGGLAVTVLGYRLTLRQTAPWMAQRFHIPTRTIVDRSLVGGASLFGLGWGLAGVCPGPAFAGLVTMNPKALLFVVAMLAGMLIAHGIRSALMKGEAQPPQR